MLTVDSREPKELGALLDMPNERRQLDVGDFFWLDRHENPVLVTRKASDLVSSIYSDHLQDEIERCLRCLESSGGGMLWAIIEGPWAPGYGKLTHFRRSGPRWFRQHSEAGGPPRMLAGLYASLFLSGIGLIPTNSLQETADALCLLYQRSQEGWPAGIARARRLPALRRTSDTRVARLMTLCPRLPERVAIRLLAEFKSISNVINADPEALLAVDGFGKGFLKTMKEVIE